MKTKAEIGAIVLCCGFAVTTGVLIVAALSGKQDRQKEDDLRNTPSVPQALASSSAPQVSISSGTVTQSNVQLSPSLAAAANARTRDELVAAAAMGAKEARSAARKGSTEVNQYGVSKADVAAAQAESLKWMTDHCDPQRNVCR